MRSFPIKGTARHSIKKDSVHLESCVHRVEETGKGKSKDNRS